MSYEHFFVAPDGTELAVITRAELERLRGGDVDGGEDARDIAAATRALSESDVRYPAAVIDAILAGEPPIAAWRRHLGLSQQAVAVRAGLTQAAISRLEQGRGEEGAPFGRPATRRAIATALGVPVGALDPLD